MYVDIHMDHHLIDINTSPPGSFYFLINKMASRARENERRPTRHHDAEDDAETPLIRRNSATSSTHDDKTKFSIGFLIALTCINGGLQVFFSTVMANLAVRHTSHLYSYKIS